jgi:hypothetical protein
MSFTRTGFAISFVVFIATSVACGGSKELEPIAECEAYAAKVDACIGKLGAGAGRARANETRSSLRAMAATAKDEESREKLRAQCADGARRLESTCR